MSASQTGRTITFTYTAATGGINNGSVTLVVPAGWSAPSTTGANAGYTTASSGTVSVASQTITVSSLTLAGGATATITYGSTASGGPGATATSSTGAQTWQAQEKSTSAGSLANLGSSPSITVYAADGTGTLTTPTSVVSASQTGRTITFTYTAATGGINNGSRHARRPGRLERTVDHGRKRRLHDRRAPAHSRSPRQTITVSSLTIAGGSTFTITYGSTGERRPRRDRNVVHRRADLAGTGEVHLRRLTRESRLLAEHHRLRRRRLRNPDDAHDGRRAQPDRPHDHLHLHRRHRRHQQRLRHARRPGRLERTLHHRRERRLHDLERGHTRGRRTDDHRLLAHARRRRDVDDHLRRHGSGGPGATATVEHRRADLAGAGEVDLRRHRSRTSAPRRASPSTPPTAPER